MTKYVANSPSGKTMFSAVFCNTLHCQVGL